jgi:hypothetical protein
MTASTLRRPVAAATPDVVRRRRRPSGRQRPLHPRHVDPPRGLDELSTPAGAFIAIGQVTALLGTYLPWSSSCSWPDPMARPGSSAWTACGRASLDRFLTVAHRRRASHDARLRNVGRTLDPGRSLTILTSFDFVPRGPSGFALSSRSRSRRCGSPADGCPASRFSSTLLAYLAIASASTSSSSARLHAHPLASVYWSASTS